MEKYKKFLDGLSTLKGTPAPLGLGGRAGPKLCLCSGGVPVLPCPFSGSGTALLVASSGDFELYPAPVGTDVAFLRTGSWERPWLCFTSLFCLRFGHLAACLGTKQAVVASLAPDGAQEVEADLQITIEKEIELKISPLRGGDLTAALVAWVQVLVSTVPGCGCAAAPCMQTSIFPFFPLFFLFPNPFSAALLFPGSPRGPGCNIRSRGWRPAGNQGQQRALAVGGTGGSAVARQEPESAGGLGWIRWLLSPPLTAPRSLLAVLPFPGASAPGGS